VLGPRLSCPLRSYGASLVPQEEQTPAAATDSTCIVYIYMYGYGLYVYRCLFTKQYVAYG